MSEERRSAVFSTGGSINPFVDDDRAVTQKPPPPPCPSPPRQKPPSKPPCPPRNGSRTRADIHESKESREIKGKTASAASIHADRPNGNNPMTPSAELILNSDLAGIRPKPTYSHPPMPASVKPRSPSQGSRHTVEDFSTVPQQGSSSSGARAVASPVAKESVLSQHNPSSHFDNVRSFTAVPATPHEEPCPKSTNGSTLNRDADHGPKQSRDIDRKRPPVVPDYPSPTSGMAPMVPSVQFQTPPLHEQLNISQNGGLSGSETSEMHTPNLQWTGSDKCGCDHSTPVSGHYRQAERSFSSKGATRGEGSPAQSTVNRLEEVHSTAGYDTSHWDADKTDYC